MEEDLNESLSSSAVLIRNAKSIGVGLSSKSEGFGPEIISQSVIPGSLKFSYGLMQKDGFIVWSEQWDSAEVPAYVRAQCKLREGAEENTSIALAVDVFNPAGLMQKEEDEDKE